MDVNAAWYVWSGLLLRWIHVVAGIAWIGHLYFFNWVNAQLVKTYDADSKKKVVPELMPRALYWFRWGAAYTWITGVLMLGLVIYMGGVVKPEGEGGLGTGVETALGLGAILIGFLIYDVLWKAMAKNESAGAVVSFLLLTGAAYGLSLVLTPRSLHIHMGSLLGTIMAANVWMRIWPAQRKIIAAIQSGTAPDAALAATAGLRSKQNTYNSVPLVFFMVSNHFPTVISADAGWILVPLLVGIGWGVTSLLYKKAASAAPSRF